MSQLTAKQSRQFANPQSYQTKYHQTGRGDHDAEEEQGASVDILKGPKQSSLKGTKEILVKETPDPVLTVKRKQSPPSEITSQRPTFLLEFIDFVINNQHTRLLEHHPFQKINTQEWERASLLFYDQLISYFLKQSSRFLVQHRVEGQSKGAGTQIIIIQDDQFRLELKQYFPAEPLELPVIQLKQESIQDSGIQLFYNRQINVNGFLLHNSNGFVKNGTFQRHQNIQLSLYSKQTDMLSKYTDNRIKVVQTLMSLPQPYYMNKYREMPLQQPAEFKKRFNIIYDTNNQPLDDALNGFIDLILANSSQLRYLFDLQTNGQQNKEKSLAIKTGNSSQILAYLLKMNLVGLFLTYMQKKEIDPKDFNPQPLENKYLDRQVFQVQNYDLNFDLRLLQYIYKRSFGYNSAAAKAKTPVDFYHLIPINAVPIMQDQLRIFKTQINFKGDSNCLHHKLTSKRPESSDQLLKDILDLLRTHAAPIQDEKQIKVALQSQTSQTPDELEMVLVALDYMHCRSCEVPIVCYHQILDTLLKCEAISEEYYNQIIQPFQLRDLSVFSFSSYCSVCGASFPIKVEMVQVFEDLDPDKKYKIINQVFKILFNTVMTSFQLQPKHFFKDFVQQYYYVLKQELLSFKQNTNYQQKKQQITFYFVCAYLQSLQGDNVVIDQRLQYKYSQMKTISFEQFTTQIEQVRKQFKLQSSIVIPSITTIKHLYNSQLNKPIIGPIIRANPDILTQLLNKQIPIYPELYQIDKFVPYFNQKISTLSPELIKAVVNTSAVDILNRSSEVVKQYDVVKRNYGRCMERNSTHMSDKLINRDSFFFNQIPKTFEPEHYKDQFYEKYCPVTLQPHDPTKKCANCQFNAANQKDHSGLQKSSSKFKQQFYQINGPSPNIIYKYPEVVSEDIFPLDYNEKHLQSIAKQLQVSYFQVANLGGFGYLDLSIVQKCQSFQQLVEYQAAFYNKISNLHGHSSDVEQKQIPKDLKFVKQIKTNWNVYRTRLNYIIDKIEKLLQALAQNQQVLDIFANFNSRCYQLKRKGSSNFFIDCQLLVNYLFQHILPELQTAITPELLKLQIAQMFREDVLQADKYSELGAFRHKKHTEINAEKVLKQLQEIEDYNSDNENEYIQELTKNSIEDAFYED